jgi:hypothetical protein
MTYIPVSLEAAALLAALAHPNHLVSLSSWAEFLCRLAATPMALGIHVSLFIDWPLSFLLGHRIPLT